MIEDHLAEAAVTNGPHWSVGGCQQRGRFGLSPFQSGETFLACMSRGESVSATHLTGIVRTEVMNMKCSGQSRHECLRGTSACVDQNLDL